MKRLMMSAVRDAHLKSILNVPVIGWDRYAAARAARI
jgi:hypothetical protein